ncbi:MAG TPA: GAF domain-containing protein [Methylomirabilota bacterium]|nr:GAF domain-containing protein [Methylomirabilota bacterium]
MLARVARAATTLGDARLACVWVVDPREPGLRLHGGHAADEEVAAILAAWSASPAAHGAIRSIFDSRQPQYVTDIQEDARWRQAAGVDEARLRAHAGIPLIAGARAVGVLSVLLGKPRDFTAEERERLDLLASHAALAIEHDRLLAQNERRGRATERLENVGRLLLRSLDPREVEQRIVDSVRALVSAQRATLVQVEPGSDTLQVLAISGEEAFPLGTGVASFAVRERRPLITSDLLADPRMTLTPDVRAHLERVPVRSVLSVPLLVGDRVIGALSLGDRSGRVFEPDEVQLVEAFADQAAIVIHNAGLYDETRRQEQEAVALEEVAREIVSSLEQDEVFHRIVDRARDLCGSDLAFLAPYDAKAGLANIVAASGAGHQLLTSLAVRPGQGAGGSVLETGEPFATEDYLADPGISKAPPEIPASLGVVALAVVPLRFRGSITGLLWVANRTARGFTSRDLRVLTKLADQGAIALENSRLYAQAQELAVSRERMRVATELHDTLSQMLFSVALGLDWCLHRLAGTSELRTRIQEIKRETGLVMKQLRALIGHLAPDPDRGDAEPDQLRRLVRQFRDLTGIPVELVEQGDVRRLGTRQQEVLYKAFQEALANVAKHARATRAIVRVQVGPDEVSFEVIDDGVGPPADADMGRLARAPGHFGLRQMLERIEGAGGSVAFGRARPAGFHLRGALPIRATAATGAER